MTKRGNTVARRKRGGECEDLKMRGFENETIRLEGPVIRFSSLKGLKTIARGIALCSDK
jgi:hypothetical protein